MTAADPRDGLLPCPFCGSDAEVDSYDAHAGTFVQCCNCGARVNGGESEWNARIAHARPEAVDEVCQSCKGSGEVEGYVQPPMQSPEDAYSATVECPKCSGTGTTPHPGPIAMKMTDIMPLARVTGEGEHGPPVGNAGRMWSWPDLGANLYGQQAVDTLIAEVRRLSGANIAYAEQVAKLIGRAGNAEALAARLAADQQKGGGEVAEYQSQVTDKATGKVVHPWSHCGRAAYDAAKGQPHEGSRLRVEYRKLYITPQPSIPAPAQQDGKASGGAVAWLRAKADEQDANNARWPEHAKCYPQWQLMPVIARQLAAQLELAHPPHADQETQS